MKVGIIGKGNVGTAIAVGLTRKGHEVKFGHRDPKEPVLEAAKWGEVIILAVPHGAAADTAKELGSAADGKPVIDVSNALTENMELAIGFTTSAAEEIQKKLPKAHVVKALATMQPMKGRLRKSKITLSRKARQTTDNNSIPNNLENTKI